jgi:hypothetical protein
VNTRNKKIDDLVNPNWLNVYFSDWSQVPLHFDGTATLFHDYVLLRLFFIQSESHLTSLRIYQCPF